MGPRFFSAEGDPPADKEKRNLVLQWGRASSARKALGCGPLRGLRLPSMGPRFFSAEGIVNRSDGARIQDPSMGPRFFSAEGPKTTDS